MLKIKIHSQNTADSDGKILTVNMSSEFTFNNRIPSISGNSDEAKIYRDVLNFCESLQDVPNADTIKLGGTTEE